MPRPSYEHNVQHLIGEVTLAQMHRPPTIPPRQHLADTLSSLTDEHVQFIPASHPQERSATVASLPDAWFLQVRWQTIQYGLLSLLLKSTVWQLPHHIAAQLAEFCAWLIHAEEQEHQGIAPASYIIPDFAERFATLTPREREVFRYFTNGKTNRDIATETGITESTVKSHRRRIYEKFGIHNNREAMAAAQLAEMLSPRHRS
jgi:DNA-binding CsgD family transcriptional regulator